MWSHLGMNGRTMNSSLHQDMHFGNNSQSPQTYQKWECGHTRMYSLPCIILKVKSRRVTLDQLSTLNYQSQTHQVYCLTSRVLSRKVKSNLFLIWYITTIIYSLLDTCNIQLGISTLPFYSKIVYEYPSNSAIQWIYDISLPKLHKKTFFDILKITHIL